LFTGGQLSDGDCEVVKSDDNGGWQVGGEEHGYPVTCEVIKLSNGKSA